LTTKNAEQNMGGSSYRSGESSGFKYVNRNYSSNDRNKVNDTEKKAQNKDKDLIIEENTVYEIDRDCYERLKSKKRK
jgi:hypothetical protein